MPKRNSATTSDYTVGYGRPPQATQFKPGQSGNPKGRPKGRRSVGAVIHDILSQRVAVSEGQKTRRLPVLEVIIRRLANDAMRTDHKALKLFLSLVDRYGASPEATVQLQELLAEDREILNRYLSEPVFQSDAKTAGTPEKNGSDENVP